ncbi:protein RRP6-like 1 [Mizuhopecten yessoensis]|uniref:Exonuclease 3'-5' domain-containing protein 1 n=1 Tax=Mizuhopecten yessoensis TaxID=6573 RepID=A0A210QLY9_MIZYE|nr:protein RRP6-like 1 [Mizuhopecten yessoensis]OWF49749.1 Exonuclease 3'-5' domain-containing protein 1 [Mizuhopecten yessoensis]
MSESKKVEVITDVSRCRDVVRELEKCDVIAVDAEGVQLGKDGPLTLLQVGTLDHVVYLFDIHTNKDLFIQGKLQDILTSTKIKKVIHSCSGDSAALYYQFNIRLRNVFDTQVAHLVIQEGEGRELASMLKLEDLCKKYSSVAKVADQKDAIKDMWVKEIGDLWARRPLSDDMVEYAAGDVTAIVPEVYNTMKRHIEERGLVETFNKRVEEEILITVDETMKVQRRTRVEEKIGRILKKIDSKYPPHLKFKDLEDEDVKMAIQRVHMKDVEKFSPLVNRLKKESIQQDLDSIEESFASENGVFDIVNGRCDRSLKTAYSCKDPVIRDRTKKIQDRVVQITLDHIAKKYSVTSPATYLSRHEKDAMGWLRPSPSGEQDPRYNKVVLALYWKQMETELDSTIQKLERETYEFVMHEGHYKKIKFYMNQRTPVPRSIKTKAIYLIRKLDQTFGRGVVPGNR